MQAKLTSREAWVRIASTLYAQTEAEPEEVAADADLLLIEYLRRFPDVPGEESAILTETELQYVGSDTESEQEEKQ